MPAAATARKAPARTATARTAPRRAPRPAPRAAPRPAPRLVPGAIGRTAVAVGGIADSGIVLGLTRSRLWIGLLATLLVGIVGLNVVALSFNATSSKTAGLAEELGSENSALRAQIADGLSNERLQRAAVRLGLVVPEPGAVLYLKPAAGDAEAAARRLRRGEITVGTAYVPPAPVAETDAAPAEAPAVDPAATTTAAPEPEATTPAPETAPDSATASAPAAPATDGGAGLP